MSPTTQLEVERSPMPAADASAEPLRPVLLTVDDDPSVSRSVARDLRRRYGSNYRIVRADSGPEALTALKQILHAPAAPVLPS
ncbi:MAG: hypothetical protein M3400_00265 [Actinomycetota bacterium]|nr:hypothetical protein [Actinomycetota bacterium]